MLLLFQPIYLLKFGADPIKIGAILGGMAFFITLSQIPSGYFADRFGPRPLMWFSWLWGSISACLMAVAGSLNIFIIALMLYGFTGSGTAPMFSFITSTRGKLSPQKALTTTSAFYYLGAVIGPAIGGYIAQLFDLRYIYFAAAIFFVVSSILILFIEKPKMEFHQEIGQRVNIFKNSIFMRIALLGFLGMFFIVFTQNFSSVYLTTLKKINLQQIGYLGTIGSLGNVVLALIFGHINPKIGYMIGFIFSLGFPILLGAGNNFLYYGLGFFVFGGFRLARSMLLAFSREFIHFQDTGIAFGIIETAIGLAIILAPILCGIVYNQNPMKIFWVSALGIIIIGIVNIFTLPRSNERNPNWP